MIAGLWAAFKVSRVAQGISAAVLLFVGYSSWLVRHNKNIREREQRRIIDEIERQTDERRTRAREASNEVERRYTTDDLNRGELRRLRARDPNNRLGVSGLEADQLRD